ncbi:hypothetical protein DRH14_04150 [Candidatus Shapirobacteria bacterium]|nr:MAG: hypothetical protein DRH14_04150 [Candidatus Shapirobacteria bacterium]
MMSEEVLYGFKGFVGTENMKILDCSKFNKNQPLELVSLLLSDIFPNENGYNNSAWADWERRIEEGHTAEEGIIAEKVEQRKAPEYSKDWPFDPGDWTNDAYWQACRLTNSMYASMVVSLWSDVEHFLKSLLRTCYEIRIAQLDGLGFGGIKRRFKEGFDVNLEELKMFSVLNAINILNISFKHSDGCYQPDQGKKHTQISPELLNKWDISDNKEINYSKLPIKTLVLACNAFAKELLNKMESKLKSRKK